MIAGSSPRVRGTDQVQGNSHNRESVHPRVCGEQHTPRCSVICTTGSSPRVRGTGTCGAIHDPTGRFIPACAGNRSRDDFFYITDPVHPRVCGEQWLLQLAKPSCRGSSPRVRGTAWKRGKKLVDSRFIPACAGNSFRPISREALALGSSPRVRGTGKLFQVLLARPSVHPRVCGEQRLLLAAAVVAGGSSPRVRGTVYLVFYLVLLIRFIPACAGNRLFQTGQVFF